MSHSWLLLILLLILLLVLLMMAVVVKVSVMMALLLMAAYFDGMGPLENLVFPWIMIALAIFVPAAAVGMLTVWLLHIWIDRTFDPPIES